MAFEELTECKKLHLMRGGGRERVHVRDGLYDCHMFMGGRFGEQVWLSEL